MLLHDVNDYMKVLAVELSQKDNVQNILRTDSHHTDTKLCACGVQKKGS